MQNPANSNHPGRCPFASNCGNMHVELHPDGGHYRNEECFDVREDPTAGLLDELPPGSLD